MNNILILSAGTRNKIVRFFKESFRGQGTVLVADMSPLAPALYDADQAFVTPKITAPHYLDFLLDLCQKAHVSGILSLIDPELSLLAKNRDRFTAIGVTVIGSDYDACETALDKMRMFEFCKAHGFKTAQSWQQLSTFKQALKNGTVDFPVFVKPQSGSASIDISKAHDLDTVTQLFAHAQADEHLMVQEFLNGPEIGVDAYIDLLSGEPISIFTKKKLKMRAGETDKAVSFKDEKLFAMLKTFIKTAGYRGPIDIDVFNVNGEYYLSEVNPRFGGGYPHAYACGVNHMAMILRNLQGKTNTPCIGDYEEGVYMLKYIDTCIKKASELFKERA